MIEAFFFLVLFLAVGFREGRFGDIFRFLSDNLEGELPPIMKLV